MKPTHAQLEELSRWIAATAPGEIDCEEFLARIGAFLESRERGATLPPESREMSRHLELCEECCEEFEVLLELRAFLPSDPPPTNARADPA